MSLINLVSPVGYFFKGLASVDTEDANPIAKSGADSSPGAASSSGGIDVLMGGALAVAARIKAENNAGGFIACKIPEKEGFPDGGINTQNPDGDLPDGHITLPQNDAGTYDTVLENIIEVGATGKDLFNTDGILTTKYIQKDASFSYYNSHNIAHEFRIGFDSSPFTNGIYYGRLLNQTPADPGEQYCWQTNNDGFPLTDASGNPIPVEGFEDWAYCPSWQDYHLPVYLRSYQLECEDTNYKPDPHELSTMDQIQNPEVYGYPAILPALFTSDASDVALPTHLPVPIPIECNNSDGSVRVKIIFNLYVDGRGMREVTDLARYINWLSIRVFPQGE